MALLYRCYSKTLFVLCSGAASKVPLSSKKKAKQSHVEDILGAVTDRKLPIEPFRLSLPDFCGKCGAKKFMFESLHFCCGNGDITIAATDYPHELVYLFTSRDESVVHFRKYARLYSNLFAFSSLGGHYYASTYKGMYLFKLQGQMYHFVPDLFPDDSNPKYLQLYFYDGQHEAENRVGCFPEIREDIVRILMQVSEKNPYATFFRSLRDRAIHADTKIVLNRSSVLDQRVYNVPAVDDVAVIWPETYSSSEGLGPHILVTGRSDESHRIYHSYGCYDPLQYPLLFPRGECGWTQGLKKNSHPSRRAADSIPDPIMSCAVHSAEDLLSQEEARSKRKNTKADKFISAREYYAYRLQIRPNNMLLLDYFRNNQETIRADLYKGILDSLDSGETLGHNVGRRVILPPTYIGGPRDMKKRYLSAMALVQRFGKPDLFVTITCNVNWPEIKAELAAGETAQDRPDLVARIFRAKLLALKKEIMEKKVFGEVTAMVYVVEFQKRGLPHAHFLIVLKPEYKLKSPADYDRFVCAEIPIETNLTLRRIVLAHMMHGPCGVLNPECPCMRKNGLKLSFCSTIKAVKYLYKYVHKGHDRISYNVVASDSNFVDEIKQYQSGRWVSPCEAAWRIFSFDLFEMHPAVFPLQEAALKLGLIEDDDAANSTMSEACETHMPAALRHLFATVLMFCQPRDPLALWNAYYTFLAEDFSHRFPNQMVSDEFGRTKDIVDALDAPIPEECLSCRSKLNFAQNSAFECIMDHVKQHKGGAFFVDGPGGTGKTFLYNALYTEIRQMNKIVLPTATSGIAATNIPSGRTAHSRFKNFD
ncbi:uncharacterized protein LOC110684972 [Chenopodium quinoa]|uniref:uncharacterized protein LOC110684972 n=1 Tax=Chenopodium quinoa TaxID=63459 RepID=UPI000B788C5F|nr:uncharacterized protein LOC110684972 [Chenopodium quinoa]